MPMRNNMGRRAGPVAINACPSLACIPVPKLGLTVPANSRTWEGGDRRRSKAVALGVVCQCGLTGRKTGHTNREYS